MVKKWSKKVVQKGSFLTPNPFWPLLIKLVKKLRKILGVLPKNDTFWSQKVTPPGVIDPRGVDFYHHMTEIDTPGGSGRAQKGSKMTQNRPIFDPIFDPLFETPILKIRLEIRLKMAKNGQKNGPKMDQKSGPKMDPKWAKSDKWDARGALTIRVLSLMKIWRGRFWPIFDPIFDPLFETPILKIRLEIRLKMAKNGQKNGPKMDQKSGPKMVQNGPFWTLSRPSGGIDFSHMMVKIDPLETPQGVEKGRFRPKWLKNGSKWGQNGVKMAIFKPFWPEWVIFGPPSRPSGGIDFSHMMVKIDPPWGVDDPGWGHFWTPFFVHFLAKLRI